MGKLIKMRCVQQPSLLFVLCFIASLSFWAQECNAVSVRFEAEDSQPRLGHAPLLVQLTSSLCNDSRCRCANDNRETVLQCFCSPQDQSPLLILSRETIPSNLAHLSIQNCNDVWVHAGALSTKSLLADVSITNCGRIIFERDSAASVESPLNPAFIINSCRSLVVRNNAFGRATSNAVKFPVSLFASSCAHVEIEGSAFSQVQKIHLSNVPQLRLHPYAFKLDPPSSTEALASEILIRNANFENRIIESYTFPSSLRNLTLQGVTADSIASNAFSGVVFRMVQLKNCTIGTLASGTFNAGVYSESIEIFDSRVGIIEPNAINSAASYFGLHSSAVGKLENSALNMPVAAIVLRDNRIGTWNSTALRLREWNRLLVDNNTITYMESKAFYGVGESKTDSYVGAQLAVLNNVIGYAQPGAFLFSAVKPELSNNTFYQHCNCSLEQWADDLTQMSQKSDNNGVLKITRQDGVWLASELLNSSLCALSAVEAQCLDKSDQKFVAMANYTSVMCPASWEIDACVSRLRGQGGVSERALQPDWPSENPLTENSESVSTAPTLSFIHLDRDLLIVIAFSVMIGIVVISLILWIVCSKRRTSKITRRASQNQSNESQYDDRTLAPLLSQEKHLGGAILSSDSIHRLPIKDYKPELRTKAIAVQSENDLYDHGNPIYAELAEPIPSHSESRVGSPAQQPPTVPLLPPGGFSSLNSSLGRKDSSDVDNKRTIDRGTQTILDAPTLPMQSLEVRSSVTDDFAEAVLAAIKEKLDLAPLYSLVKDHLPESTADSKADSTKANYDLIRVIESNDSAPKQRPPLNSDSSEGTYSKPWTSRESVGTLSNPTSPSPESAVQTKTAAISAGKSSLQQAGSLPKWPPSATKNQPSSRSTPTSSNKTIATSRARPLSPPAVINPVKDSKPPWRVPAVRTTNFTRPTGLNKKAPVEVTPKIGTNRSRYNPVRSPSTIEVEESPLTQEPLGQENPPESTEEVKRDSSPVVVEAETVKAESSDAVPVMCEYADPQDLQANEYSQVTPKPFSFTFKKPLFQLGLKTSLEPSRFRPPPTVGAPPKPARQLPAVSDYSDPKDKAEHVYAELPEAGTEDQR